eukprot:TRINITY_DN3013_c0_g3_i1.p1 TRINITY_DN3013_c0_g3~~TRINITY_DN3013_c0_g3_i1.p1  ORF type:complete len:525 (-),score=83.40 TRINITY_DN3013_c0_g3_i1:30-1604(-)
MDGLLPCVASIAERICGKASRLEAITDAKPELLPTPPPILKASVEKASISPDRTPKVVEVADKDVRIVEDALKIVEEDMDIDSEDTGFLQRRASRRDEQELEAEARCFLSVSHTRPVVLQPAVPLVEDPSSKPFFTYVWAAGRNDYDGEAGIRIVCQANCEVTALGRPAAHPLMEAAVVTLWDAAAQVSMAAAEIGPRSRVEGDYAWEHIRNVRLQQGCEYRLTQRCKANMQDRWCDVSVEPEEIQQRSWASLASFAGGACRNKSGFPNRPDGDTRRPGIVNFKAVLRPSQEHPVKPVSREHLARYLAKSIAIDEKRLGGGAEQVEKRMAVLAASLALFVDLMDNFETTASAMALLGPEDELRLMVAEAAASDGVTTAPGSESLSIFDSQRLARIIESQARSVGYRDGGLVLVSATSGEVLGILPCARLLCGGSAKFDLSFGVSNPSKIGRPLAPAELALRMKKGITIARNLDSDVTAFLPEEVCAGKPGLCVASDDMLSEEVSKERHSEFQRVTETKTHSICI